MQELLADRLVTGAAGNCIWLRITRPVVADATSVAPVRGNRQVSITVLRWPDVVINQAIWPTDFASAPRSPARRRWRQVRAVVSVRQRCRSWCLWTDIPAGATLALRSLPAAPIPSMWPCRPVDRMRFRSRLPAETARGTAGFPERADRGRMCRVRSPARRTGTGYALPRAVTLAPFRARDGRRRAVGSPVH